MIWNTEVLFIYVFLMVVFTLQQQSGEVATYGLQSVKYVLHVLQKNVASFWTRPPLVTMADGKRKNGKPRTAPRASTRKWHTDVCSLFVD